MSLFSPNQIILINTITVDVYNNTRKNNLTPALTASPLVGYANAGTDIASAVAAVVDPKVAAQFNLTPAAIGNIYKQAVETLTLKNGAMSPLGLLSSDQSPTGKTLDLTYYNIKKINYTGIDLGLNYAINNKLSIFSNYSYLSKVYWDKVAVTGTSSYVPFSLNQPNQRLRIGFDYVQAKGIVFNATMRYQTGFESVNGSAWSGSIPSYKIFDAGIGYAFNSNLVFNVSATNLFNEKYRAMANAPYITRLILGKITYKFGK